MIDGSGYRERFYKKSPGAYVDEQLAVMRRIWTGPGGPYEAAGVVADAVLLREIAEANVEVLRLFSVDEFVAKGRQLVRERRADPDHSSLRDAYLMSALTFLGGACWTIHGVDFPTAALLDEADPSVLGLFSRADFRAKARALLDEAEVLTPEVTEKVQLLEAECQRVHGRTFSARRLMAESHNREGIHRGPRAECS